MLILRFSGEVETKPGDFAIAASQELAHAKGDKVFVYLDLNLLVFACALDGEACFDVYFHFLLCVG